MGFKTAPAEHIISFDFDTDLLLFDMHAQQFYLLNLTSRTIWYGIDSGLSIKELISCLSENTGSLPENIQDDVLSIVKKWQDLGLVTGGTTAEPSTHKKTRPGMVNNEPLKDIEPCQLSESAHHCSFEIIGTRFTILIQEKEILELVVEYLGPNRINSEKTADIHLSVMKTPQHYILYKNRVAMNRCVNQNEIIPMIHAMVMMSVYELSQSYIGIHAAAMSHERSDKQVHMLFPAFSGKGKSTLMAALAASGFGYGADDLVLLTQTMGVVQAVPTPIALKPGSWPVLSHYYPDIYSYSKHMRCDNQAVRYLPLNHRKERTIVPQKVNYIIYPEYDPEKETQIRPISPARSVMNISNAGLDLHRTLDRHQARQLVEWIKSVPSFTLTYHSLESVISLLRTFDPA